MVPVQYRCINLSEITRGHPLAIWDVIGKPHVYLWTHVSMLLPFDKQMEFPSQSCWMIINSCSYMHRAKQRPPVTSAWAVAKAVLWRTSYDIFQDPQTKMTGDCDMSTASSKKKTSCGWQMLKKVSRSLLVSIMPTIPLGIHVLLKLSRGTLAMPIEPVELLLRLRWLMRSSLMLCWLMISLWILVCWYWLTASSLTLSSWKLGYWP